MAATTPRPANGRAGWIVAGVLLLVIIFGTIGACNGVSLPGSTTLPTPTLTPTPTATTDPVVAAINAQTQQLVAMNKKIDGLSSSEAEPQAAATPTQRVQKATPSPEPEEEAAAVNFNLEGDSNRQQSNGLAKNDQVTATSQNGSQNYDPFNVSVPDGAREYGAEGGSFWVEGGVDVSTQDAQAQGQFVNTLGLGTQSWLAEPGKLLVDGWDFDLNALKGSGGAIDTWNPTSQEIFGWMPPAFWNLNEGGFALLVGNRMTVAVPDRATFHVEGDESTAWIVIMRGLYSDAATPNDRNLNVMVKDYVPGNIMAARYSGTPNGGFISEGQFNQLANTTQKGSNDCGQSGCPKLYALFYDANTGGWLVIERDQVGAQWTQLATNMDYLQ